MKPDGKIEFKTLPMMTLRNSPGEILDRVSNDNEVFVVERNGQPKVCLVPISFFLPDIPSKRIGTEIQRLRKEDEHFKTTITEKPEIEFSFHEIVGGGNKIIRVVLPSGYPSAAPKLFIDPLETGVPQLWDDGSIKCFGVMEVWDSKRHNVLTTLKLGRQWLKSYTNWRTTKTWTEPERHK